jgi:hypothetical protein
MMGRQRQLRSRVSEAGENDKITTSIFDRKTAEAFCGRSAARHNDPDWPRQLERRGPVNGQYVVFGGGQVKVLAKP